MRRLNAEEQQLWQQLAETVKPLKGRRGAIGGSVLASKKFPFVSSEVETLNSAGRPLDFARGERVSVTESLVGKPIAPRPHANTLDANWDKRLSKGSVQPDRTIDLHGHHLSGAHAMLDLRLGEAVRSGARLVLLITGRPARDNPRLPPTSRGVIRASVMDWIAAGPWASHIAAVRGAHPRHGGAGALYLIIRRAR